MDIISNILNLGKLILRKNIFSKGFDSYTLMVTIKKAAWVEKQISIYTKNNYPTFHHRDL